MTCRVCEAGELVEARENYLYRECGLENVTIVGISVRKCPACGALMPLIPNIEGLHESLARAIIRKDGALSAAEIVFLRKSLGWSGSDFARQLHCTRAQVSKWEHGAVEMSKPYDLLLRELVAHGKKIADYRREELVWQRRGPVRPFRFQLQKQGWREAA